MAIQVRVTREDVRGGECMNPVSCAIARAVRRTTKKSVEVGSSTNIKIGGHNYVVAGKHLRGIVNSFINEFDRLGEFSTVRERDALARPPVFTVVRGEASTL